MSSPEGARTTEAASRATGAAQATPVSPPASPPDTATEPTPAPAALAETVAKDTQEYLRAFIELADQKAAFIFTGASAVLAYLYSKDAQARWIIPPSEWNFVAAVAFVAMLGIMATVVLAIAVVMPRRSGTGKSAFYWDAIAAYQSADAYAAAAGTLTAADVVRERQRLCYDLALVCQAKYRYLNGALRSAAVGSVATLVYLLIYSGSAAPSQAARSPASITETARAAPARPPERGPISIPDITRQPASIPPSTRLVPAPRPAPSTRGGRDTSSGAAASHRRPA